MKKPKIISATDLLKMKFSPNLEKEYRRGYCDGFWEAAAIFLEAAELVNKFPFDKLKEWENKSCDKIITPPSFKFKK